MGAIDLGDGELCGSMEACGGGGSGLAAVVLNHPFAFFPLVGQGGLALVAPTGPPGGLAPRSTLLFSCGVEGLCSRLAVIHQTKPWTSWKLPFSHRVTSSKTSCSISSSEGEDPS